MILNNLNIPVVVNMLLIALLLPAINAFSLHLNISVNDGGKMQTLNPPVLDQTIEHQIWNSWKLTHDRKYESVAEENYRREIFNKKKTEIEEHNKLAEVGKETYYKGINQFSDWTHQEFLNILGNFKAPNNDTDVEVIPFNVSVDLPAKKDWRETGAVLPVKNQGHCGSLWE